MDQVLFKDNAVNEVDCACPRRSTWETRTAVPRPDPTSLRRSEP